LKEISYYPKDHAWEKMWTQWPSAKIEMDKDLDRIKALGFNTVRIFLQPDAFGYPTPSHTKLAYFEQALALIHAHGLKAHVNLFDCWGNWADISGSEVWLRAIVAPHRDDPRIAVWELKNEIIFDPSKPDYQPIRDWFQALFPFLKAQAGNIPVTVSVYNVEWLADVKALSGATPPDIYSLHWYPNEVVWTDEFPRIIDRARQLIGQAPLLIGEFGLSRFSHECHLLRQSKGRYKFGLLDPERLPARNARMLRHSKTRGMVLRLVSHRRDAKTGSAHSQGCFSR
jgi:endo-1,4-beta-mannosidase